jgi:hypothetical protein
MSQMYFVGDYVTPKRTFLAKDTGGYGRGADAFVDVVGRRTTFGQVVAVSSTPLSSSVHSWDYKTSTFQPVYLVLTITAFVYTLKVWDIDAAAVVTVTGYPETELLSGPVFGPGGARHVDLGALPSDVAAIAAGLAASGDGAAAKVLASSGTIPAGS